MRCSAQKTVKSLEWIACCCVAAMQTEIIVKTMIICNTSYDPDPYNTNVRCKMTGKRKSVTTRIKMITT